MNEPPKRDILFLNCQDGKHSWRFVGAKACCCEIVDEDNALRSGECSISVFECDVCGDCDYGENDEARQVRAECDVAGGGT